MINIVSKRNRSKLSAILRTFSFFKNVIEHLAVDKKKKHDVAKDQCAYYRKKENVQLCLGRMTRIFQ